jgi:carboxyl-terminal processing protease
MDRSIKLGAALCAAGVWMAVQALAETAANGVDPAAAAAGESPAIGAWAQDLCAAVEEGARLLEENHLTPGNGEAKAALLEALIRASEPAVVFLDEAELAARSQRLSEREWDAGLTVVAMEGLPRVAAVRAGSPAADAGIQPGELVQKVGGLDILAGTAQDFMRERLAEGDEAALEIGLLATNGTDRVVSVERVRQAESSLTDVESLPAGMGYLRASGIHAGAGREIVLALETWQAEGKFGAILDLRGAGGTAEEEVGTVAKSFAAKGSDLLYEYAKRDGDDVRGYRMDESAETARIGIPLMVLVDEGTTGAAELLAAVLGGGVKGAMIIGRETSGDPLLREPRKLSTGRYALLATRQLKTADGAVYSGSGGVVPDVAITAAALDETVYEPDAPVLRKGKTMSDEEKEDKALRDRTRNDTYLRRATDVLLGLKALGYDRKP